MVYLVTSVAMNKPSLLSTGRTRGRLVTEQQLGTADVTVIGLVADRTLAGQLVERFALRSRQMGSVVLVDEPVVEEVPVHYPGVGPGVGVQVMLRYRHTAKNRGNHGWDAQRFFTKAIGDRGTLVQAELNAWEPVQGPRPA
jgi:hypothetical protein